MKRLGAALLFVLCVSAVAAEDHNWKLYAHGSYIAPTAAVTIAQKDLQVRDSTGWGMGVEWRFNFWGGLEFEGLRTEQILSFGGAELGRADVDLFSLALNTHLIDNGALDVYFGPVLAWVDWDEIVAPSGTRNVLDDDLAPGVQAGLDIGVTKRLAVVTGVRYLKTNIQRGTVSVDIDPLVALTGVAVRF